MRQLFRSHLFWFFVIGILLLVADRTLNRETEQIVVDDGVVDQLRQLWTTQMGRPPDESQLLSIIDNWIDEELYFREALRLGLDHKDTIIRRRLVQKLTFVAEDVLLPEPSEEALEGYFHAHENRYQQPAAVSFAQVFMKAEDLESAQQVLVQLNDGADYKTLGRASLLPRDHNAQTPGQIAASYGNLFADRILALAETHPEGWQGPIESAYGLHLVKLHDFRSVGSPTFAQVEEEVTADYIRQLREETRLTHLADLKDQYQIIRSYTATADQ